MKKLLFALSGLAAFSLFFIPGLSIAEPTHPNEVGLYMSPDGLGATGTSIFGQTVDVYLVLTNPTNTNTGTPYDDVLAFECNLGGYFDPNLFYIGLVLNGYGINLGTYRNIIAAFNSPTNVTNESVMLATLTFLPASSNQTLINLQPTIPASISGEMAFESIPGQLEIMHSVGGSHDATVFAFMGEAVAVEKESFGSVKALYR